MKTYRIPLMILAALLVLAIGAVTASAVHYAAAARSGEAVGSSHAPARAPALLADEAPLLESIEIRLEVTPTPRA